MFLKSFCLYLIFLNALLCLNAALPVEVEDVAAVELPNGSPRSDDCLTNSLEQSLYCRGSRAIRNVIHNLNKSDKPIVIIRGLEIVRTKDETQTNQTQTQTPESAINDNNSAKAIDDSFLGRFANYLRTHELNIKFSDLLAEESERYFARDLERNGMEFATGVEKSANDGYIQEARKKDKGQGILMAMALMFGKMMAVLGLGGIGALAMKALGVAMAALMMAGIVGLKSLSQHSGGHESSHSVQYLTPDGHHHRRRRRRSLTFQKPNEELKTILLPYRAWQQNSSK